jgi:hypothetical protein
MGVLLGSLLGHCPLVEAWSVPKKLAIRRIEGLWEQAHG